MLRSLRSARQHPLPRVSVQESFVPRRQRLDQCRADHDAISRVGDDGRGICIAYPESNENRQADMRLELAHALGHLVRIQAVRPGHALERHVVEIASSLLRNRTHPWLLRVRRREEDRGQTGLSQVRRDVGRFFRREIDDEHPVDTSRRGRLGKTRVTHGFDRIQIAHQHDGRLRIAFPEAADNLQHIDQAQPLRQSPFAGQGDGGTVGHRIGKRNAQFKYIRARLDQCMQ